MTSRSSPPLAALDHADAAAAETVRARVVLELPENVIEAVAERAAALVLERIAPTSPEPELLTVPEAAEFLRAKPQRVYDLISAGQLERFKDGRRVLVRRADLVAHLLPRNGRNRTNRSVAL